MGYPTEIQWCDATWNPIGGCSIKSPGCAPCYAQKLAGTRLKTHPLYAGTTDVVKGKPVFNGKLTAAPDDHPIWRWPIQWKGAKNPKLGPGMPSLIFVGDMSDLFHEDRPHAHIDRVFGVAGACEDQGRSHILQLLTKRPDRMASYIAARGHKAWNARRLGTEAWPARNIWLGFSAERQKEFDERWPHVRPLALAGWTIFVSYEPAIGPLRLPDDFLAMGRGGRLQLIAGGMSGHDATGTRRDLFRAVRDQCRAAGVAYFHKQNGEWIDADEWLDDLERGPSRIFIDRQLWKPQRPLNFEDGATLASISGWKYEHQSDGTTLLRVGKKRAGRKLDGVEHNEFPKVVQR